MARSRAFCIPGIVFLFLAVVLLFLVSLSLPFIPTLEIVKVTSFNGSKLLKDQFRVARLGIWAYCWTSLDGSSTCSATGHGYGLAFDNPDNTASQIIGGNWTRGLAALPVATVISFIALLLSFSQHLTVTLASSLVAFLAAFITLICFAIEIALFAYVHHKVGEIPGFSGKIDTGAGFWMTFVSLILLLLAGCTVCFGRRRDTASSEYPSYPMSSTGKSGFFSRFRRN